MSKIELPTREPDHSGTYFKMWFFPEMVYEHHWIDDDIRINKIVIDDNCEIYEEKIVETHKFFIPIQKVFKEYLNKKVDSILLDTPTD